MGLGKEDEALTRSYLWVCVWADVYITACGGWSLIAACLLCRQLSQYLPLVPSRLRHWQSFSSARGLLTEVSAHIGAHQTQVADHVQNPVAGGKVQRRPSILQETKRPGETSPLLPADDMCGGDQEEIGGEVSFLQKLAISLGGKPNKMFSSISQLTDDFKIKLQRLYEVYHKITKLSLLLC